MKNKKHLNTSFVSIATLVFAILCVGIFSSRLVMARDGGSDNNKNETEENEPRVNATSTISAPNEPEQEPKNETRNEASNETNSNRSRNDNVGSRNDTENETSDTNAEDASNSTTNEFKNSSNEHGKSCEARQRVVTRILTRAVARGNNIVDVFTKITTRTESFYVEKGNTLSNYEALAADVAAKKAAAQAEILTVQNLPGLTCPISDSKTALAPYKSAVAKEIQVLKDYKTAVKNLVEGVASVQPDDEGVDDNSSNNSTLNSVSNTSNATNEVNNETR